MSDKQELETALTKLMAEVLGAAEIFDSVEWRDDELHNVLFLSIVNPLTNERQVVTKVEILVTELEPYDSPTPPT